MIKRKGHFEDKNSGPRKRKESQMSVIEDSPGGRRGRENEGRGKKEGM